MEEVEHKSWLPKPEEVIVGLDEGDAYGDIVMIVELEGHS